MHTSWYDCTTRRARDLSSANTRIHLEFDVRRIRCPCNGKVRREHLDFLAVMRWAQNPRDRVSGFRAIQLLPGIGPKTAARILDNVAAANPVYALLGEQPVPESARVAWNKFVEQLAGIAATYPNRERVLTELTLDPPDAMGDRYVYASRTRFIPNALLVHFDQVSWPLPEEHAQAGSESSRRAVDLAAQMRATWS